MCQATRSAENANASSAAASDEPHMPTRAWPATRCVPLPHQTPHRALRQLLLSPSGRADHRCAAQRRDADERPRRVESLGRAPIQLATDDLGGANDACRARARAGRETNTSESIRECAHLFVAHGICQLGFRDRLAPADDATLFRVVADLVRIGSMTA